MSGLGSLDPILTLLVVYFLETCREICKFHPEAQFVGMRNTKKTPSAPDILPNDSKLAQLLSPR